MLTVVGSPGLRIAVGSQSEGSLVGQVLHIGQQLFGHGNGASGAVFGQVQRKLLHFIGNLIASHYKIDEAEVEGFSGTEQIARKQQFTGFAFANFTGEEYRNDGWNEADTHFCIAEIGGWYGKAEVCDCGQAASAGNGVAFNLTDNHLRAGVNHLIKFHEVARIGAVFVVGVLLQLLQVAQIGSGTKYIAFGT